MIRLLAPVVALSLAGAAPAQQTTTLPVHIAGRVAAAPDGSLDFGWPGVYIEGRFRGAAVRIRFDAPTDHIRLSIDGVEHTVFRAPGAVDTTIAGLDDGDHIVRLDKLTETQAGGSRFIGFEAVGGAPLPARPRRNAMEFIGDSFTVGYGNISPDRQCTGQQVHDLTDTSATFGPLAANALGADYRIVAFSGFGIVRNYDGNMPGQNLPALYPRAIPGSEAPAAADPAWRPRIIVINLGGNDFSTPVKPGEAWADGDALKSAYRTGYTAFVTGLAARQPQAHFILMGGELFHAEVETVAARLRQTLPGRIRTLRFTGLDLGGCHYHPSRADHRLVAGLVADAIRQADQGFR